MACKVFYALLIVLPFTIFGMEPAAVDRPLDKAGNTLLIKAIASGNIDEVERLIKLGANVNLRTAYGITPFSLAFMLATVDPDKGEPIVDTLRKYGATAARTSKIRD